MPIDSQIPLQVRGPEMMTPQQAISLQNLARQGQMQQMQMQEQQREMQNRNALIELVRDPSSRDPVTGTFSQESVNKLYAINPQMAQQVEQRRHVRLQELGQLAEKQYGAVHDIDQAGAVAYQQAKGKMSEEEARRAASSAMQTKADELEKSGLRSAWGFDDAKWNSIRSRQFDPSMSAQFLTLKDVATQEHKAPVSRDLSVKGDQVQPQEMQDGKWVNVGAPHSRFAKQAADKGGGFEGKNGELLAALAEKGVSLPAGFRSKEQQLALLNSLRERNPNLSADEIADKVKTGQIDIANVKKAGQVAAGIAGKVAYAENEIEQTIPLVREASAKLPRGQFIPFNKLKMMGESSFSNPDLAEFRMYMTSLSNAYDMLAARGGTDVEKRAESRKNFETAQSPEALERVLQAVQKEARASGTAARKSMESAKTGEAGGKPSATAPQSAIDYLKAHPEAKDQFRAKYGYLP